MPPLPHLRMAALNDLARQLRFAPIETLRRQLERARQLAPEIDSERNYPEDWIIFRITGYRPQLSEPATLVGEALLSDISALVERLSAAANIREAELVADDYLDAKALCERWSISRKTLDRYRRAGLLALRVVGADGRPKHMFPMETVEWFEERHAARLAEAQSFARVGIDTEQRMLRCAALYARAGLTLNQAAVRIARRYGRGQETVRQLLRRSSAASPLFTGRGPPSARERRLMERAYWLWIEPAVIARHTGRSRASVQRVTTDGRSALLRTLKLPGARLAVSTSSSAPKHPSADPAGDAALKIEAVTQSLGMPGETDLLLLVQAARTTQATAAPQERSLAIGYHSLLGRAGAALAALPAHGALATIVDRIETDLRWAARLKAVLMRSQLAQLVRTYESLLNRPLEDVRTRTLVHLVTEGIAALSHAVDAFEPRKGGRLAAAAGMALNRAFVQMARERGSELSGASVESTSQRAAPRLLSSVSIPDWTLSIAPWQRRVHGTWLEPDHRIRIGLSSLDEQSQCILVHRFGWAGPPQTHVELAELFGTKTMRIARQERSAARRAIAAVASRGE